MAPPRAYSSFARASQHGMQCEVVAGWLVVKDAAYDYSKNDDHNSRLGACRLGNLCQYHFSGKCQRGSGGGFPVVQWNRAPALDYGPFQSEHSGRGGQYQRL